MKGEITLRVDDDGSFKSVVVPQGSVYLLPSHVAFSAQRPEGSIGLRITRSRRERELDGIRWYCRTCNAIVLEEYFQFTDSGKSCLIPLLKRNAVKFINSLIDEWEDNLDLQRCLECGAGNSERVHSLRLSSIHMLF